MSYECANPQCLSALVPTGQRGRPRKFCSDHCKRVGKAMARGTRLPMPPGPALLPEPRPA